MLTKYLTIVDLLKKLIEARSKTDRQYVEDFLDPLWQAFTRVHEDYKVSFAKYRSMLSLTGPTQELSDDNFQDEIRGDMLCSRDILSDLQGILNHLPSPGKGARDQGIRRLGQAIMDYFQTNREFRIRITAPLENLRVELITNPKASRSNPDGGPLLFIKGFSGSLEQSLATATDHIHTAYSVVADAYHGLRADFLKPK